VQGTDSIVVDRGINRAETAEYLCGLTDILKAHVTPVIGHLLSLLHPSNRIFSKRAIIVKLGHCGQTSTPHSAQGQEIINALLDSQVVRASRL
jgi:hypothetical protein